MLNTLRASRRLLQYLPRCACMCAHWHVGSSRNTHPRAMWVPAWQVLQYLLSCVLCARVGACPHMPPPTMGRLLGGCYSICRAACSWNAVACVSMCLCAPLCATVHQLGRCYSTRQVCTNCAHWVLSLARHAGQLCLMMKNHLPQLLPLRNCLSLSLEF